MTDQTPTSPAQMKATRSAKLAAVLCELTELVRGECPQLLQDAGGHSRLSIEIDDLLDEPTTRG